MFIDYIYLILIIIIICFIIFMIYLSYEYRDNEHKTIEPFDLPNLNTVSPLIYRLAHNNLIENNINNQFNNISTEIQNKDITRDNIKNIETYKKQLQNVKNVNILNGENITIEPVPSMYPIDKLIKTIKSNYNSQYLSTFANDSNHYGILVNDKCLTVNGLCKDEFCTLNCQNNLYSSDTQKFKTTRIQNSNDAAKLMNVPASNISNKNIYPFNIFKSLVNDKCLTISNDGITIEKCNLNNIKQQWQISPDENICLLN